MVTINFLGHIFRYFKIITKIIKQIMCHSQCVESFSLG